MRCLAVGAMVVARISCAATVPSNSPVAHRWAQPLPSAPLSFASEMALLVHIPGASSGLPKEWFEWISAMGVPSQGQLQAMEVVRQKMPLRQDLWVSLEAGRRLNAMEQRNLLEDISMAYAEALPQINRITRQRALEIITEYEKRTDLSILISAAKELVAFSRVSPVAYSIANILLATLVHIDAHRLASRRIYEIMKLEGFGDGSAVDR